MLRIAVLLALAVAVAAEGGIFAVFQDEQGNASLSLVDMKGQLVVNSSITFNFPWPLVETTVDTNLQECYIIAFPRDAKGAVLYRLDGKDLSLRAEWRPASLELFDLQYSASQSTLYGIAVSSRFGRVLSNFSIGKDITAQSIVDLPYTWYMNASTFDQDRNRYLGLLNNFPGQPNSTLGQKVVSGFFSQPPGSALFKDLYSSTEGLFLRFVTWSKITQQLVGVAQALEGIHFVSINADTGEYTPLALVPNVVAGPSVAVDNEPTILAFAQTPDGTLILMEFDITAKTAVLKEEYGKQRIVAAATFINWL